MVNIIEQSNGVKKVTIQTPYEGVTASINALTQTVAGKADKTDVNGKANQSDLDATNAQLADIAIDVLHPPAPLVAAKGDGVTDDTSAIQNIINSLTIGTVFFPPNKTFIVGDIVQKSGVTLKCGFRSAAYSSTTGMSCLKAKTGASYILKGSGFGGYAVEGLFFNGNNKATHGISGGMSSGNIKRCFFYQCDVAFGNYNTTYASTSVLEDNSFTQCNTAITNIRDSRVLNNFIYSNARGIYLSAGSNDNIISLNKIEWNSGYGVEVYQSHHNIIDNNIYDRNSKSAIKLSQSNYNRIGGLFRRNGADTTVADIDQSHIQLSSCIGTTFSPIMTIADNNQDDGSGVQTPKYSIYSQNNDKTTLIGSDLTGCTTQDLYTNGDTNFVRYLNNGDNIIVNGVLKAPRYSDNKKVTVNASSTYTGLQLSGGRTIGTFDRIVRKLKVTCRNTATAATYYGEKILVISREGGNASIVVGSSTNYIGSTFLDNAITFSNFTCEATGASITFDVTNTLTNNLQLTFEMSD